MATIDIRKPMKKFLPYFLEARDKNLSESDTVMRLTKVFEEALGYDSMTEITSQYRVKDRYVDLAIQIGKKVSFFIEVKASDIKLHDKHIEQAQNYAANDNVQWVLLTNGIDWALYHLTFKDGIQYDKAFEVCINCTGADFDKACNTLSILHRKSVTRDGLSDFWDRTSALSPASIAQTLYSEDVIGLIRRNIRKKVGILLDEEEVIFAIHNMFSHETRENAGPARLRRKRKQGVGNKVKEVEIRESVVSNHSDDE